MLTLLFGAAGSGKTARIFHEIEADIQNKHRAFLLVPEQSTVNAEVEAAHRLPPSAPLSFEVTNFTRLADTVFRLRGGVASRYADEEVSLLLARDAAAAVAPLLHDKRRLDAGRVREILSLLRECKISSVSPAMLDKAGAELADTPGLAAKLHDLSLLLSSFESSLADAGYSLPTDAITRMADILRKSNPLSGAHLYLDGFTSFTAVQRDVLACLLADCELTVALPMPSEKEAVHSLAYAEVERTRRELFALAAEGGVEVKTVELGKNLRAASPLLASLATALFSHKRQELPPKDDSDLQAIRIFECRTPYSEAELVAADIAQRVQEGARYRDFAIIARTAEDYRGVLDSALARYGIPAYFSLPRTLSAFEAVKLIRAAYAAAGNGLRREDVITYLKCGLSGIGQEEADCFELYAERLSLDGRRLLEIPFRISSAGYSAPRSEKEAEARKQELAALNKTREEILSSLRILEPFCKQDFAVKEHASALFSFLSHLHIEEQLYQKAQEYAEDGDTERADEYARLFETIVKTLDVLVELLPESRLSGADFSELLSLLFSTKSLRTIPPRVDAVTVGSADSLRLSSPRHVYLIGVNEGVFPREGADEVGFSSDELTRLASCGIQLDRDCLAAASREYFCFLRAFSAASEGVTLTYYLSGFSYTRAARSEALNRILILLADRIPIRKEEDMTDLRLVFNEKSALLTLGKTQDTTLRHAIGELLSESETAVPYLERSALPLNEAYASVDPEEMRALYGKRLSLSQSRIERYVSCPFSYFCEYVLRLGKDNPIVIHYAEIGSFVHAVLEYFFNEVSSERLSLLDEASIAELIGDISARYLSTVFPSEENITPRIRHRFERLGKRAAEIVRELREELSHSSFTPLFFEYTPSATDTEKAAPPTLTLEDGTVVTLNGQIDRVDIYRSEGNAYLRVIDYKTGTKNFSLEDIARGKNLQTLIYLFSLWHTEREAFARSLGIDPENGKILPAGAMYLSLSLATRTVETPSEVKEGFIKRSGLLLNEPSTLLAMDSEGAGRFIPLTLDEEGNPKKGDLKNLATLEEMGALSREVEATVASIAGRIGAGEAHALPHAEKNSMPCDYCAYAPVCRRAHAHDGASAE